MGKVVQLEDPEGPNAILARYREVRKDLAEAEESLEDEDMTVEEEDELTAYVHRLSNKAVELEQELKEQGAYGHLRRPSPEVDSTHRSPAPPPTAPNVHQVRSGPGNVLMNRWGEANAARQETTPHRPALTPIGPRPLTPPSSAVGPRPTLSSPMLSDLGGEFARVDMGGIRQPQMDPGLKRDLVQAGWLGLASFLQILGGLLIQRMMMGHSPADFQGSKSLEAIDYLDQ